MMISRWGRYLESMKPQPTAEIQPIANRKRCNPYYDICTQTDAYYEQIDAARFLLRMRTEQPDRFPEPLT